MRFAWLALALSLFACGHTPTQVKPAAATITPDSLVVSDDDYERTRADYEAMPENSKDRGRVRAGLESFLLKQAAEQLDRHHDDEALGLFHKILTLYSVFDLRSRVNDAQLATLAERIEQTIRKRGTAEEVLLALVVQRAINDTAIVKGRYADVIAWVKQGAPDMSETGRPVAGRLRLMEDLERASRYWPSPLVVGELTQLYITPKEPQTPGELRELVSRGPRASMAFAITRLYMRVSRPQDGLEILKKLDTDAQDQALAPLRALVERHVSPNATPQDAVNMAMLFAQSADDREVAVRVCRDAAVRFPRAIEPRVCAGELARLLDQVGVAILYYEDALKIDPQKKELWEQLSRLYRQRLYQMASDEDLQLAELEPWLAKVKEFYAAADKQFGADGLRPSVASAYLEVGRGYFNGGRPQEALQYLQRAADKDTAPMAFEIIGQIQTKKGQYKNAIISYSEGIKGTAEDRPDLLYWRAKLLRLRAEAEELGGETASAAQSRRAALDVWDAIEQLGLTPEGTAEAGVERGKLLYLLAEQKEALKMFAAAVEAAPDRGATYADMMAFLIPRGELEQAVEAYHRALGRTEVTDYLKVYCSLWVNDLLRRASQPDDPLAVSYLRSTDGGKWYHDLARWASGRESDDELQKRATTPGRRAELNYYEGLAAWEKGKRDVARGLWKQVIDTEMMAFFEYDMAGMYLRNDGPPSSPIAVKKPPAAPKATLKKPPVAPRANKPPEGSI